MLRNSIFRDLTCIRWPISEQTSKKLTFFSTLLPPNTGERDSVRGQKWVLTPPERQAKKCVTTLPLCEAAKPHFHPPAVNINGKCFWRLPTCLWYFRFWCNVMHISLPCCCCHLHPVSISVSVVSTHIITCLRFVWNGYEGVRCCSHGSYANTYTSNMNQRFLTRDFDQKCNRKAPDSNQTYCSCLCEWTFKAFSSSYCIFDSCWPHRCHLRFANKASLQFITSHSFIRASAP